MKLFLPRKLYCALIAAISACTSVQAMDASWELVFHDEFSSASFDTDGTLKWNTEGGQWNKIDYVGYDVADWRKYQSRDDALVTPGSNDGVDYVTLKGAYGDYTSQSDQSGTNNTFACGGIFTEKTFTFQYGYMEVRARFESVAGCWPAIWLLPKNSWGWPQSGEIDIMEHINFETQVHQTLHFHNNAGNGNAKVTDRSSISNTNGWHTYGLEWTESGITFYVDGSATNTISASQYTNWPFSNENHEFYLLIDQQIGGSWVGDTQDSTALSTNSADFDIDYVRVFSTPGESSTDLVTWGDGGPVDAEGNALAYTAASATGGDINLATPGNHQLTVNSAVSRILATGSNLQLGSASGTDTINMQDTLVQADSLYITGGKYKISGSAATLDVDTLILDGGSLQVDSRTALSGVKKLYLGMETDTIGSSADRNASLYFTKNQAIGADVTLIDDTKISVYQGNTVEFAGNVSGGAGHTLNMVGVNSNGTATIRFSGAQNTLSRVSMGVAETVNGHTFKGGGQVLDVRFGQGSTTTIGELVTNSPNAVTSSLHVENGATLTVTGNWRNNSDTHVFNVHIETGGTFDIGNGTDAASANNLAGVELTNKGTLNVNKNASLSLHSMLIDASQIDSGRASLNVRGQSNITTLNMNSNTWQAMATLNVLAGAEVNIDTLNVQSGGEVRINVRDAGTTATVQTLNGSTQAVMINADNDCTGTLVVKNTVTNAKALFANHGKAVFEGGVNTTGNLTLRNGAVAQLHGTTNNVAVKFDNANAVLETAGDYANGAVVSGSGTVRKSDAGHAQVTTAADFSGSVEVRAGSMTVTGSASYASVMAQNALTFKGMNAGLQVQDLSISGYGVVSVYTNNIAAAANEATLTVSGSMIVGGGGLNANLVLADGAALDFTGSEGLVMGSSITLNGKVVLGENLVNLISSAGFESFTLASSLDGFVTGTETWQIGELRSAGDYFTAADLDMSRYALTYYLADAEDSGSGTLALIIPEPATASLALLALAGMAARRRRE